MRTQERLESRDSGPRAGCGSGGGWLGPVAHSFLPASWESLLLGKEARRRGGKQGGCLGTRGSWGPWGRGLCPHSLNSTATAPLPGGCLVGHLAPTWALRLLFLYVEKGLLAGTGSAFALGSVFSFWGHLRSLHHLPALGLWDCRRAG